MPLDGSPTKIKRDAFIYLEPEGDGAHFAQCATCWAFMPKTEKCAVMGGHHVTAEMSCDAYGEGQPTDDQKVRALYTAKDVGLVERPVRCENCLSFDGKDTCQLYVRLNKDEPGKFDLDPKVKPHGCCNAQTPKEGYAAGGAIQLQDGGSPDTDQSGFPPGFVTIGLAATPAAAPATTPQQPPASQGFPPGFVPIGQAAAPPQQKAPSPLGTADKPFVPGSQARADWFRDNAPPGSWILTDKGPQQKLPEQGQAGAPTEKNVAIDYSGMNLGPAVTPPSATSAFIHGAERGALPAAGGMAGFGAGAELGAAIGAPLGPIGIGAGALIGGVGGALAGGYGAQKAQDVALAALPESAREAIGQSAKEQASEETAHPYATMAGELAPNLALMSPFAAVRAVPETATAVQRVMSNPWTARAAGAGIMGAQEAASEKAAGQPIDPIRVGIAGAAGAAMQRETALGARVAGAGASPIRAVTGANRVAPTAPTPPAVPPENAPAPGEGVNVRLGGEQAAPQPMKVEGYGQGYVSLTDEEGTVHQLSMADFNRLLDRPAALEGEVLPPEQPGQARLPPPSTIYGPEGSWSQAGEGLIPPEQQGFVTPRPEPAPAQTRAEKIAEATAPADLAAADQNAEAQRAKLADMAGLPQLPGPSPFPRLPPPSEPPPETPQQEILPPFQQGHPFEPIQVFQDTEGRTGRPIAVVRMARPPEGPAFDALFDQAERLGGGYGMYRGDRIPAFVFPTAEAARAFAPFAERAAAPRSVAETPPAVPAPRPAEMPPPAAAQPPLAVTQGEMPHQTIRGAPDTAYIPSSGAALPVEYAVTDIGNLVPSHNDDLSPNRNYPQALQPRHRERGETEAQIASILNGGTEGAFRPELLGESQDAATGAPIVGPEGYVEGGNGRIMALRRAYERGLPQADQYRTYLQSKGYPVEGIEHPVLVRINRAGMDMPQREQLAHDLNVPAAAAMSATEQAMADAKQVPPELLRSYQGGDLFSAQNGRFVNALLRSFVRTNELPAMTNPDGGLSQAGQRRVQNALLAKAYGDSGLVAALTEDPDSHIKAIGGALLDAAPAWGQLRESVAAGRVPQEYDLTDHLLEAVRLVSHAREDGRNVAEFVNQRGLFGEGISPEAESMLSWMLGEPDWTRRFGRQKIADALDEYVRGAQGVGGMFGERHAPLELTELARARAQGAAADLFAPPVAQPRGAEAVRPIARQVGAEAQRPEGNQAGVGAPAERAGTPADAGYERAKEAIAALGKNKSVNPGTLRSALGIDLDTARNYLDRAEAEGLVSAPGASRGWRKVLREDVPLSREEAAESPFAFQPMDREWAAFREAHPEADPHQAARDFVRDHGEATGDEHAVVLDRDGNAVHVGTNNHSQQVTIPLTDERAADPAADLIVHHNHPGGGSLSGADLAGLGYPGIRVIAAHTGDGDVFAAELSPALRQVAARSRDPSILADAMSRAYKAAARIIKPAMMMQVLSGKVSADAANRSYTDMINRAVEAAGLTHYVSTRTPEGIVPVVRDSMLRRAATEIRNNMRTLLGRALPTDEEIHGRVADRSAVAVRPDDAMAEISRIHAENAGQPAGTGGAPPGTAGIGRAGERAAAMVGAGPGISLAEERPDFSDVADSAIVEDALGPPGRGTPPPSAFERLGEGLGTTPRSPGYDRQDFNIINKDFTFPRSKAAYDPISTPKWIAELSKKRYGAQLLHGYQDTLASWQGKPAETWRKLFSAMELLTLDGRKVPLDGRAIIAENRSHPLAALSKPGDVVKLETPEEIGMFADYQKAMNRVWNDLTGEIARKYGGEGATSSRDLEEMARQAGTPAVARQLQRAARIVSALEWQRRASYLPLMRSGDYFIRVTPKAGTPDKPSILGWTGDGFPPTTMFKMMDAYSPWERALGGRRSGTPGRAQKAVDDLRSQFPEAEYNIDHGFVGDRFADENAVRNLQIPAVEKLMMLVGSDVRTQIADRLRSTSGLGRDEARRAAGQTYDGIVDSVLGQVYDERLAGFRRQRRGVAGYDADFAQSTGKYLGWLSNYISDIRYRDDIEAADQKIAQHPDPRTRAFWRDWDRREEDRADQMGAPLMRARQAAFYWLLGLNAASTAKITLHGPLLGVPTLTTGLGVTGRSMAAASYLNAARQMLRGVHVTADGLALDPTRSGGLTADERALIADAETKGILHPQGMEELAAIRGGGEQALTEQARFGRRVLNILGSNVSMADRLIRSSMLLAGYRTALREGMDAINKVWDRDETWRQAKDKSPAAFAQFMVDRTAGIWGDVNRLPIFRSKIGAMVGQFRTYETNYLSTLHQLMWHMGPEGRVSAALMLGGLGMLGGTLALPFATDAKNALQYTWNGIQTMLGNVGTDFETEMRNAMDAMFPGSGMGEDVLHGFRPFGIDYGSVGFGDLVSRNIEPPLGLVAGAGPAAGVAIGSAYRAGERLASDQGYKAALREAMPNAVKHMMDALYPESSLASAGTGWQSMPASELSEADRVRMGLGFQTASHQRQMERYQQVWNTQDQFKNAISAAENRIANLTSRGEDTEAAVEQLQGVVKQAEERGVFGPAQMGMMRRQIAARILQRMHPELPSRTMQRMQQQVVS